MRMITRQRVIEIARSYIGVPFRLHGRDRTGLDCVGLLYCVGRELGLEIEDNTNYTRRPHGPMINAMLEQYTNPSSTMPPRSGQVLKLRQHIFPMHLGFLVVENGRLTVINSNFKKKGVTEDPWDDWKDLVLEHRDIKGVR